MKEFLSQRGFDYIYSDISLEIGALKKFLKIRDTNVLFDEVKEKSRIGIPTIIIDDQVIIDFDEEKLKRYLE